MTKKSVWDKTVKAEKSRYHWEGDPKVYSPTENKNFNSPTVFEMFSGCGGTSLGFEMAGFDIVMGTDVLIPAIETFRKNHNNSWAILSDVSKISPKMVLDKLGDINIDVMVAGVPCQGFSLNNRKRWEKDERNYLFIEFIEFVEVIKPRAVLIENVTGLKKTSNGKFVNDIEQAIEMAGDYEVHHKVLNAADYGVPQTRERIFFVGFPAGSNFKFPEKTHGAGTNQEYRTVYDAISDLPGIGPGEKAEVYSDEPKTAYQKMLRKGNQELYNHEAPRHQESTIKRIDNTNPGEPMYQNFTQRIRLHWKQPSPTQVAGGIRPQFQLGHPQQPRGLSVRERCRIQSFPDEFMIYGGMVQGRVQTGNAVPPLLAKAVAQSIKNVL